MAKRESGEGSSAESQMQELLKMGEELQQQQETLQQQLARVKQSRHRSAIAIKSAEAAVQSMREARPEAKVYRQIARLFVLEPRGSLIEDMREKAKETQAGMAHLAAVQEQIMAKISSVNEQSQDVMQQIKKTMERELARRT